MGFNPSDRSIQLHLQRVLSVFKWPEQLVQIRMLDRLPRIIGNKVLFGHISHIIALIVFSQKMIKRLFLFGAAVLWDCLVPSIRIRKHCIHIKYDPSKRMLAVPDNLAKMIFSARFEHLYLSPTGFLAFPSAKCLWGGRQFEGNSL